MVLPPSLFLFSILLLFICRGGIVFGGVIITTPQELIDFTNEVNSGTSYSGETVYLGADLDFTSALSSSFAPIGKTRTYYFKGTFDGQGHMINNLTLSSTSEFTGLLGCSYGATIKGVVMDSSCSVVNSYDGSSSSDIGSICGWCELCTVENIVNMGSVTFIGNMNGINIFMGGFVGRLLSSSTIKNCVNYGPVTHSGITDNRKQYIGGIVGGCVSSGTKSIENCANYGTITHNGTSTSTLYMGGIVGCNYWGKVSVVNCVSSGKIMDVRKESYIGSIVGYVIDSAETTITHCYWTSNVGFNTACGNGSATTTDSYLTELSTTTMNELNTYANTNSWNKWFMLHLNGGNINNISQESLIVTQKYFPDPVKEGNTFSFWCTCSECTEKYNPETTDVNKIADLYATWDVSVTVFDFRNGTKTTKKMTYGEKYGTLPEAEKEGYTFVGWFTEENGNGEEIVSETLVKDSFTTLYGQWTINNYTLTFIFNNSESDEVRILNYSNPIVDYPDDPVREGYTFNGWDNKDIITMPAHNLNITALWEINNYTITFIFNNGKSDEVRILNYNSTFVYLNDPVREGYSFNGWDKNITTIPAYNLNITALWIINNYTLIFILNNGKSDEVRTLNYNEVIEYPEDVTREGYTFNGWSSKPKTMPAHNLNITAQWVKTKETTSSEFVEIVFGKKDLSEEEVKAIVSTYTEEEFVIEKFEVDSATGEIRVIIRFVDSSEAAAEFVRNVNENTGSGSFIREVGVKEGYVSLTNSLHPTVLSRLFIFEF